MEPVAFLFPGQGSQVVGMGKQLAQERAEAREVFQEAERIFKDFSIQRLCFEGPEENLRLTLYAQPAIFTVSMASYQAAKARGISPSYMAGHSVGEYSALTASGVFPFSQGLQLVKKRGELMHEAGRKKPGGMTAILGFDAEKIEALCQEVFRELGQAVEIANVNSPSQIVISGEPEAVKKAGQMALKGGARKAIPLPVSGAFHSSLMAEAAEKLAAELDRVEFRDPLVPVISNVTGKPVTRGEEIRALLKRQIREKVLWEESMRFLINQGVHSFLELEPGNVLSGLVRSLSKSVNLICLQEYAKSTRVSPS